MREMAVQPHALTNQNRVFASHLRTTSSVLQAVENKNIGFGP
jgi:hypothetical protein